MSFAYWIKHRLGAQQIINYSSAATDSVVVGQFVSRVRLFCNPTDCSLSGSSVHGISQARILERVAIFLLQEIFPIPGIEPMSLAL